MGTYRYSLKRYFTFTRKEWVSVLLAAVAAGFILSYNDWGGATFDLGAGISNLLLDTLGAFLMIAVHVAANKAIAIFYGIWSDFERYGLGLLIGVFIAFLTFGLVPIWTTGYFRYKSIPNLRLGKFRGTLVKPWEEGLVTAGTVLASLLITIPLGVLYNVTGVDFFFSMTKISLLIALYAMIPFPLVQTTNVYQVYMTRMESIEANLPGYDLFWASPTYYCGILGLVIAFSAFTLLFGPSTLTLVLSLLLGLVGIWVWTKLRELHRL